VARPGDPPGDASVDVDWNIWTAQLAERGKFDLGFIVDSQFIGGTVPGRGLYVVDAQHDDPAAYADWLAVTRPIVDRYLRGRAA
jgi:hypothetical protein